MYVTCLLFIHFSTSWGRPLEAIHCVQWRSITKAIYWETCLPIHFASSQCHKVREKIFRITKLLFADAYLALPKLHLKLAKKEEYTIKPSYFVCFAFTCLYFKQVTFVSSQSLFQKQLQKKIIFYFLRAV